MTSGVGKLVTLFALSLSTCSAYYHYVHYTSGSAPYGIAPEKFDLSVLPNKTVTFFVTDSGPSIYPANDSFSSVLSQIRQAAQTWNNVDSSDLRVAFGGLYSPDSASSSTPGGQVVFEELPPGLLGYGGPTTCMYASSGSRISVPNASSCTNTTPSANGTFFPITRAVIHLSSNLTKSPGPSYSEAFFLTAVHEMGHALGLQHTYTSSAMSTAVTRATSLTRPIDADDIAGISVLYPAAGFGNTTGIIQGRVTSGGRGVHMASVVAIRNGSGAVSALTNPDGIFRIEGVPVGQYFVYAHPLPSQANPACVDICPPVDASGQTVAPGSPFNTIFYGQTTDLSSATPVTVTAGNITDGVSFDVQTRKDVPVSGLTAFSWTEGSTYVNPAYLNIRASSYSNILVGPVDSASATSFKAQVMGSSATIYDVRPYTSAGSTYLNISMSYGLGASAGPQHLIFTLGNFIYILPSGLNLVQNKAPSVSGVATNSDGSVNVTGANFLSDSAIYFDGLPSAIRSLDLQNGVAVVIPPPGASGQNATVSVYNHDGQNSSFVQPNSLATYAYGFSGQPTLVFSPVSLPAGSEAVIDMGGVNTKFTSGQTVVGFGTNDVFVRSTYVLSPARVLANVSVLPNAVVGATETSVISGFQIASQKNSFSVLPAVQGRPNTIPILQNAVSGQTGAYPGAYVTISGTNLVAGGTTPTITIGGQTAQLAGIPSSTQLSFQVPSSLASGPVVLQVNNGLLTSYPVAVYIDSAPAVINSILNVSGKSYDNSTPAQGGQIVRLMMSRFGDGVTVIYPSEVKVTVGGISHPAISVVPSDGGLVEVRFVLSNLVASGSQVPVTVYLDGRSSLSATMSVLNQ